MTASVLLHGVLHEVSAYPENSGSVRIEVRDRLTGTVNCVTIFTGSEQVAREIYEALGPIFQRHGGSVGPVHVRASPPQEPAPPTEPAPDSEGWIEWGGGECPVPYNARVEWRLRDAYVPFGMPALAVNLRWQHLPSGTDIIAYRVVREEC